MSTEYQFSPGFLTPAPDPLQEDYQFSSGFLFSPFEEEEEERNLFINGLAGVGERGSTIVSNLVQGIGTLAEAGEEALYNLTGINPYIEFGEDGISFDLYAPPEKTASLLNGFGESLELDLGFQEQRRFTWEDYKDDPFNVKKLAGYIFESGVHSLPDMVASIVAYRAYALSRSQEIAEERAANKGLDRAGFQELAEGAFTALPVAALERLGAKGILNTGGKGFFKGLGIGLSKEAGTEFLQEQIEYAGETLGTNVSWDLDTSLDRGLAGAVAGGGVGAVGGGVSGTFGTPEYDPFRGLEPQAIQDDLQGRVDRLNLAIEQGQEAPYTIEIQRAQIEALVGEASKRFPQFEFNLAGLGDPISVAARAGQQEAQAVGGDALDQASNAAARTAQVASTPIQPTPFEPRTSRSPLDATNPNDAQVLEDRAARAVDNLDVEVGPPRPATNADFVVSPAGDAVERADASRRYNESVRERARILREEAAERVAAATRGQTRVGRDAARPYQEELSILTQAIRQNREQQREMEEAGNLEESDFLRLDGERLLDAQRLLQLAGSDRASARKREGYAREARRLIVEESGAYAAYEYRAPLEGELLPRLDEQLLLEQNSAPALPPAEPVVAEQFIPMYDPLQPARPTYDAPRPPRDFVADREGNVGRTDAQVAMGRRVPETPILLEQDVEDRPSTQVLRKANGQPYPTRQSAAAALVRVKRENLDYNWDVIADGEGFALQGRLPEGLPPQETPIREVMRPGAGGIVQTEEEAARRAELEEQGFQPREFDDPTPILRTEEDDDVAQDPDDYRPTDRDGVPAPRAAETVEAEIQAKEREVAKLNRRKRTGGQATNTDLFSAIEMMGGIQIADARSEGLETQGAPRGVFKRNGLTLDAVREQLVEDGYLPPSGETYDAQVAGVNETISLIDDSLRQWNENGDLPYVEMGQPGEQAATRDSLRNEIEQLRGELQESQTYGTDPGLPPDIPIQPPTETEPQGSVSRLGEGAFGGFTVPEEELAPRAETAPQQDPEPEPSAPVEPEPPAPVEAVEETPPAAPEATVSDSGRIEDFGERIEGARKDLGITFTQAISDAELDVEAVPLSKSVPQPDYAKLAEEGVDREVLAAVAIIRAQLKPAKPKRAYKLRAWVKDVNQARELIRQVTEGELSPAEAIGAMDFQGSFRADETGAKRVLQQVANADPAKMAKAGKFRINVFYGSVTKPDGTNLTSTDKPLYYIGEAGSTTLRPLDVFATLEETQTALESLINEGQETKKTKQSNINIYQNRRTKEIYLGWKGSTGVIEIMGFATGKEAREYLNNNREDVERRLAELKEGPKMRRDTNRPRQGKERRAMVEDVTPELFAETFGFRGVQFGNYVEGGRRQKDLNQAFDALMDLADVLKIPPQALSLNGSLGLAFGARGKGGKRAAAAHYEPGQVVINLTKGQGAGSLAHEWWHAVDNYFSRQRNRDEEFVTDTYASPLRDGDQIRSEMLDAFRGVMAAIGQTNLKKRGLKADKGRSKKYWSTPVEMSARSFEKFVIDMLDLKGVTNDYLANISTEEEIGPEAYPYPNRLEADTTNPAFTAFFDELKFRDTDQGVEMYSRLPDRDGVQQVDNPSRREVLGKIAKAAVVGAAGVQTGSYYLDVLTDPAMVRGKAKPISDFVGETLPEASLDALRNNDLVGALEAATEGAPADVLELVETIKRLLPDSDTYNAGVEGGQWNALGVLRMGLPGVKPRLIMFPESSDTGSEISTLLHESLHLVIAGRYRSLSESGSRNFEMLGMDQPAAREALDQWIDLWREFQQTINPNRFVGQKERDLVEAAPFAEQIAYQDPDEFFTRALTDPEFQGRLHAIDYQGKTLWERFKDWVKTFLFKPNTGVQPTFLDAVMTASHDIFESADFDRPDMAFNDAVNERYVASRRQRQAAQESQLESRLPPREPNNFTEENKRIRDKEQSLFQRVIQQAKRQLAPGGLLPKQVFDAKIDRDNLLATVEFDTVYYVNKLEKAVKETMGVSFDQLPDNEKARINDSVTGNLDSSLPEQVKEAVVGMRESIDGLSTQYITILDRQLTDLTSGFTEPQIQLLNAYLEAKEIDTTTREGKLEAQEILDRAKGQFKETTEAAGMSSDLRQPLEDIQKAVSQIGLLNVIRNNVGKYVNRSYKAFDDPDWNKKVPDRVLADARIYLRESLVAAGVPRENINTRVEVIINDILKEGTAYDSMEAFIKESTLGAKDLSVLQKRKDVAPEIRALLGEYTDTRINYAKTTAKMARLIFNTRFLDRVLDIGVGEFLFTESNRPPNTTRIAAEGSKTLEPLNGLYAPRDIAQAFKDFGGMEDWIKFPEAIIRLNGLVKYGKTVAAPTTQFRNFWSASQFALANGHFDVSQTMKSLRLAREYFTRDGDKGKLAYLRKLKKLGVVYDTPFAGEMMKLLEESKILDMESKEGFPGSGTLRQFTQLAQRMYQYGDDFWKIVGYENEKNSLMGTGMAEAEAEVEAARRIRMTYPTYSLVGNFVNQLRRFPLAGTFVSFPAEIIRTQYNQIKIAADDMRTPGRRRLGARRLAGMSIAASIPYGLQALTKEIFKVSDEEEEAIRIMAPYWTENSNLFFMGRDEKGRLEYMDLSFLDPYNYFKRAINAAMRDQPWEESFISGAKDMLRPFFGSDILATSLFEIAKNEKATGGKVYKETDSLTRQAADMAGHVSKAVQPGIVGNAQRIYKAAVAPETAYGKVYTLEDEAAAFFGFRSTTFDPKIALSFRTSEIRERRNEASSQLTAVLRDPNLHGVDGVQEAVERSLAMRERTFTEAIRLIEAAKSSGLSDEDIFLELKGAGFGQLERTYLLRGEVPPMVVSSITIRNNVVRAARILGPEKAEQLRERYGIAIDLLQQQDF